MEPVITARRLPVTADVVSHPLATKTGITLLGHLISADIAWSGCTKPQRVVLAELCAPVAEVLLRDGAVGMEHLPCLPAHVRVTTLDALRRRGMVDESGRLTGKAVHAWFYAVRFKEDRAPSAEARAEIDDVVNQERTRDARDRYVDCEEVDA